MPACQQAWKVSFDAVLWSGIARVNDMYMQELEAAAGFPEGGAPDGPSAEALERAAALLQGAAASTLDGPSSAELEAAAALIQGAAAAALDPSSAGPSAEDLERATGLIQDAAASRPDGPSSSELEAAAALIQGVAPRP